METSSTPLIRPVRLADNAALANIIRSVLDEFDGNRPGFASQDPETDAMFEAYSQPGWTYFVIEVDGEVKGGGGVGPLPGEQDTCELQKMYFLPDLRGQGMGKQMLNTCLAAASELGYKRVYLETLSSMKTARHLYQQFGFSYLDHPMGHTGHSGCNSWMIRDLDPS